MITFLKQASKKPDLRRCFAISVSNNGQGKKERYFCVLTTNNGSIPLKEEEANLVAIEWVTQLNRRYKTQQVKTAQEALKSLTVLDFLRFLFVYFYKLHFGCIYFRFFQYDIPSLYLCFT